MADPCDELEDLRRRVIDALGPVVAGTEYAPPEGGIITEAVAVMVWMQPDGEKGLSFVPATASFWSTEGLLRGALRYHLQAEGEDDGDG